MISWYDQGSTFFWRLRISSNPQSCTWISHGVTGKTVITQNLQVKETRGIGFMSGGFKAKKSKGMMGQCRG